VVSTDLGGLLQFKYEKDRGPAQGSERDQAEAMPSLSGSESKNQGASSNTTTTASTLASEPGDTIIVGIAIPSATITVSSITDSSGNTYTLRSRTHGTGVSGEVWSANGVNGTSTNALTITLSAAVANWSVTVGSYAGVGGIDVAGTAEVASSSSVSAIAVAANSGELLVGHIFTASVVILTGIPGGYSDIPGAGTSFRAHQSYLLAGSTGGTNTFSATLSSSLNFVAVLIALSPETPNWSLLAATGKPIVTVSPIGIADGATLPNNGADYGPDTAGTVTSGIQEAINGVQSQSVFLLAGTFTISASITPANSSTLRGAGIFATIVQVANAANVAAIAVTNPEGVQIMDLTLDGNAANQTTSLSSINANLVHNNGVSGSAWNGFRFYRVRLQNSVNNGISLFTNGNANPSYDLVVRDCVFLNIGITTGTVGTNGMAIAHQGPSYGTDVTGNLFEYIFGASYDSAGLPTATYHTGMRFVGNYCRNTQWAALDVASLRDSLIDGNVMVNDDTTKVGSSYTWWGSISAIFMEAPTSCQSHFGVVISGNLMENWNEGTQGRGTIYVSASTGVTSQNVSIIRNISRGITNSDGASNIIHFTIDSVANVLCSNNIIDASADAPGTGSDIGIYILDSISQSTGEISHNTIQNLVNNQVNLYVNFLNAMSNYLGLLVVDNAGFNPYGLELANPTFPTSGTYVQNKFPFPVIVRVQSAGTMTQFFIKDRFGTIKTFNLAIPVGFSQHIAPGESIAFTYTVIGTWFWYGL
jgi:hypothetical protein